jgi:MFS family permease
VALGVGALTALQDRINKERCFVLALGLSGVSLLIGVSMSTFWLSAGGVFGLGLGAGSVYVLGFTLLQEGTSDELRGRTFSTLLSNVRLCVLGAMVAGPGIAAALGPLLKMGSGHGATVDYPTVTVLGLDYPIPPVRVTLWIASVVIILATLLSANSIIGGRALDSLVASDKAEPHDPNHPL